MEKMMEEFKRITRIRSKSLIDTILEYYSSLVYVVILIFLMFMCFLVVGSDVALEIYNSYYIVSICLGIILINHLRSNFKWNFFNTWAKTAVENLLEKDNGMVYYHMLSKTGRHYNPDWVKILDKVTFSSNKTKRANSKLDYFRFKEVLFLLNSLGYTRNLSWASFTNAISNRDKVDEEYINGMVALIVHCLEERYFEERSEGCIPFLEIVKKGPGHFEDSDTPTFAIYARVACQYQLRYKDQHS